MLEVIYKRNHLKGKHVFLPGIKVLFETGNINDQMFIEY